MPNSAGYVKRCAGRAIALSVKQTARQLVFARSMPRSPVCDHGLRQAACWSRKRFPASPAIRAGRIYAETHGAVNTGIRSPTSMNRTPRLIFLYRFDWKRLRLRFFTLRRYQSRHFESSAVQRPSRSSGQFHVPFIDSRGCHRSAGLANERGES